MPRLEAPENGVTVRMYRQGHGDCFLLALPREQGGDPYYVLIDCGLKPGSQKFLDHKKPIGEVVDHIHASTGGKLDLVVLTHEHQDHLNGIWKKNDPYFAPFTIDEAWVAWTEDPDNELANELREHHHDQLLGLLAARRELALAVGEADPAVQRLDSMLGFELGGGGEKVDVDAMFAAASDPEKSVNKQALKLVKDKAAENRGFFYLSPGGEPVAFEGSAGYRAYVFGPPESADLIADEDPRDEEAFPEGPSLSFASAVQLPPERRRAPFPRTYSVPAGDALDGDYGFFTTRYGRGGEGEDDSDRVEATSNAPWRRIDEEWLFAAESLALKLNSGINNTSLVLGIEMPRSKKILFFAADAQRGNWVSWSDHEWSDGDDTLTARDILSRVVLYKVGHHGSHNATLSGKPGDDFPNLSWMGHGVHAGEFTAMITAVYDWATTKNTPPWVHPLPSIRQALERKCQGRVLQTDVNEPTQPDGVSNAEWAKFKARAKFDPLFFDLAILDE